MPGGKKLMGKTPMKAKMIPVRPTPVKPGKRVAPTNPNIKKRQATATSATGPVGPALPPKSVYKPMMKKNEARPGPVKPKPRPTIPAKKVNNTKVTYKTQTKGAVSGIAKMILDPFSDYSKKTTVKTKRGR